MLEALIRQFEANPGGFTFGAVVTFGAMVGIIVLAVIVLYEVFTQNYKNIEVKEDNEE